MFGTFIPTELQVEASERLQREVTLSLDAKTEPKPLQALLASNGQIVDIIWGPELTIDTEANETPTESN